MHEKRLVPVILIENQIVPDTLSKIFYSQPKKGINKNIPLSLQINHLSCSYRYRCVIDKLYYFE